MKKTPKKNAVRTKRCQAVLLTGYQVSGRQAILGFGGQDARGRVRSSSGNSELGAPRGPTPGERKATRAKAQDSLSPERAGPVRPRSSLEPQARPSLGKRPAGA